MHPNYILLLMILMWLYGVLSGVGIATALYAQVQFKEAEVKKMSSETFREFADLSLKNHRQRMEREEK